MIVLDNDILVKIGGSDPEDEVVSHLKQYSDEEWAIPAIVAFEFYKSCTSRTQIQKTKKNLEKQLDRIIEFDNTVAVEAAYLDERLQSQGVTVPTVDLLNLATAYSTDSTFITHNKRDFDKSPIYSLTDLDVVYTSDG